MYHSKSFKLLTETVKEIYNRAIGNEEWLQNCHRVENCLNQVTEGEKGLRLSGN